MAPPNVTVVQGLGQFGAHSGPAPPTSSVLSYLYQSGLYAAAAAQHQGPFGAAHRPHHPLDGIAASPFLHAPAPVSAPDVSGFPFPAPSELTSAGLVAAAAAAAGLHLNPAALMLSAAGQLAAHPWLYPGYLAAAAALGQSAAAVALQPATDTAVTSPPSPSARHRHHLVSSSSRFVPYPGRERRRSASGRSTPVERSPTTVPRAATPPPAPDTTDSPPAETEAESASPAAQTVSPGPPSGNSDDGQLKNMEQMVNGLDHAMKARIVTSSGGVVHATSNDANAMDVDSSKIYV